MSASDKLDQLTDAIATRLLQVPDVGRVHQWERYAIQAADLKALYVVTVAGAPQLRGWCIKMVKASDDRQAKHGVMRTLSWVVEGVMALSEELPSEPVFRRLVETMCEALRSDLSFGHLAMAPEMGAQGGVDVARMGPVKFCGVLCHGATITFQTRHMLPA